MKLQLVLLWSFFALSLSCREAAWTKRTALLCLPQHWPLLQDRLRSAFLPFGIPFPISSPLTSSLTRPFLHSVLSMCCFCSLFFLPLSLENKPITQARYLFLSALRPPYCWSALECADVKQWDILNLYGWLYSHPRACQYRMPVWSCVCDLVHKRMAVCI